MCAEDADPAYIATQRAILAGIQSIRDGTFSCDGSSGSTSRSFSSLKEYELVPLVNPGVPGGAGPADHYVEINFRKRVAILPSRIGNTSLTDVVIYCRDKNGTGSTAWLINGIQYDQHVIHCLPLTATDHFGLSQVAPAEPAHAPPDPRRCQKRQ
jgi:hypothetical protein